MGLAGIRSVTIGHFFGHYQTFNVDPQKKGALGVTSLCLIILWQAVYSDSTTSNLFDAVQVGALEHGFYFSIIYGMSSFPLTNSYFSRWLKPPISYLMPLNPMIFQVSMARCWCFCVENWPFFWWTLIFHVISVLARSHFSWCIPQIPSFFVFLTKNE